ncbi:ATP-binding protein [Amycolatopsis benzoatilytica]|uniref:ATP-binding protein n=1 Tax=Amycolatopsis benzoatilytica TaxID=346045 RepID=UPI00035D2CDD|nr:ATP-binding protein [Amycolatopsis benzoatilytica]
MNDEGPGSRAHGAPPAADRLLDEVVELRLPAATHQIPLVRVLAQAVAARADYGLDAIADAKMAVDEACAQAVGTAAPGAAMTCRFTVAPGGIRFTVETSTLEPLPPSERSFGWHVLTTLAANAAARCVPDPAGGYALTLELDLHRETSG